MQVPYELYAKSLLWQKQIVSYITGKMHHPNLVFHCSLGFLSEFNFINPF